MALQWSILVCVLVDFSLCACFQSRIWMKEWYTKKKQSLFNRTQHNTQANVYCSYIKKVIKFTFKKACLSNDLVILPGFYSPNPALESYSLFFLRCRNKIQSFIISLPISLSVCTSCAVCFSSRWALLLPFQKKQDRKPRLHVHHHHHTKQTSTRS